MKIILGENLRSLRNKENVTQEQLAEALGVSPQAVSRWENEAAFPDISLLPVIANYFDVTTDYLLGADTAHKQREIDAVIDVYSKLRYEGKTREAVDFLREKVKEFPSNHLLLHYLASSLFSLYHQSGISFSDEEKSSMAEESIACCKRALRYNSEPAFKALCSNTLILNYVNSGEKERAKEIADTLPSLWCSHEMLYGRTLEGKAALKEYQNVFLTLIDALIITMGKIRSCGDYSDEQIAELADLREKLIIMLAGENPCWLNERLFNMAMIKAKVYVKQNDFDKLSDIITRLMQYAQDFEEMQGGERYSVFWLDQCENELGGVKHSTKSLYERLKEFIDKHGLKERFMGDETAESVLNELERIVEA